MPLSGLPLPYRNGFCVLTNIIIGALPHTNGFSHKSVGISLACGRVARPTPPGQLLHAHVDDLVACVLVS